MADDEDQSMYLIKNAYTRILNKIYALLNKKRVKHRKTYSTKFTKKVNFLFIHINKNAGCSIENALDLKVSHKNGPANNKSNRS